MEEEERIGAETAAKRTWPTVVAIAGMSGVYAAGAQGKSLKEVIRAVHRPKADPAYSMLEPKGMYLYFLPSQNNAEVMSSTPASSV